METFIRFRTNLDLFREEWPENMIHVPRVGEIVVSNTVWPGGFRLALEVVKVTYRKDKSPISNFQINVIEVELHDRKIFNRCITEFYEWYAPKVGKSVSFFI